MTVYLGKKPVGVTKIVKKEIAKTKFGISIDDIVGEVDEEGILRLPTEQRETHLKFTGVKHLYPNTMRELFKNKKNIKTVDFLDVEIVDTYACCETFWDSGVKSVSFGKIKRIASQGMQNAFYGTKIEPHVDLSHLESVGLSGCAKMFEYAYTVRTADLSRLETVGQSGLENMFNLNSSFESIDVSSLKTLGARAFVLTFKGNAAMKKISFPSLVEAQNNSFGSSASNLPFYQSTAMEEIHFRADAQTLIESLYGYSSKFGATSATIYFDLIGTITVNGVAYSRNEPNSIRSGMDKFFVAWVDTDGNIVYTGAAAEPAVGTVVYSDNGTTQVGTVEGVA